MNIPSAQIIDRCSGITNDNSAVDADKNHDDNALTNQWPFQDPKLEVPTIYKAYIRPM